MTFLDQVGQFGSEVFDSVTQIVGGVGDSIENQNANDKILIQRNQALIGIETAKAAQKIKTQQANQEIFKIAVFSAIGLLTILVGAKIYKDLK